MLVEHIKELGYKCVLGSETDVLSRFNNAAEKFEADVIVRITGDCPFVDYELVDAAIEGYFSSEVDYFSNVTPPTYPDGLDVEVFSRKALKMANLKAKSSFEREHVTAYIRNSTEFNRDFMEHSTDLSSLRWTLDEPEDLKLIENIYSYFAPEIFFSWKKILDYQLSNPKIFLVNKDIVRNEGAGMGTGQKLYKRAKKIIPGGNMLLSKRPEMFLPDAWPSYFSKAKGCEVWDLDGNKFVDMSVMGIGTNILGYCNQQVDSVVRSTINSGNMSTLNCPEEVFLAEKLVEIHPWSEMVKFARSGGEANALAIRIARAASGRDKVAVCGYHGWHDWYLSVNLNTGCDDGLANHLLPGLTPTGVPTNLANTVFPFTYNNFDELRTIVES